MDDFDLDCTQLLGRLEARLREESIRLGTELEARLQATLDAGFRPDADEASALQAIENMREMNHVLGLMDGLRLAASIISRMNMPPDEGGLH